MRVRDPAFETRVRESFSRQRLMESIGARLRQVAPGQVEIEAPFVTPSDGSALRTKSTPEG